MTAVPVAVAAGVSIAVAVAVAVSVGVAVAVAVGVGAITFTATDEDGIPLATTTSVLAPPSVPAATSNIVETVALPVAIAIVLWP